MTPLRFALLPVLVVALAALAADEPEKPKDVGLSERTSTTLAQIDVTVSGPKDAIEGLTAADFEVRVQDKILTNVIVDALCGEIRSAPETSTQASSSPEASAPGGIPAAKSPVSYLFYFDMPHLTQGGRQAAIAAAREMLPKLMAGGNRAMLVSNAKELHTLVPLTTDVARLDAALAKLVDDIDNFDPYSVEEEIRLAEVLKEIEERMDRATQLARDYAREERQRQERDLTRLRMVLGRLAELDAPKATLYFADTMRQNPGQHYLSFFSASSTRPEGTDSWTGSEIALASNTGAVTLDRVMNEAAANGIRFYTVEGQGLAGPTSFIESRNSASTMSAGRGSRPNQASPQLNTQRTRDSQGTLVSMAVETGGRAFLNGITPAKMTSQILSDFSCVYLLSFDPAGFKQDAPLMLSVKSLKPKVKTYTRGRIVIASESTRLTARLMSAYAAPEAKVTSAQVRVGVIPVGYKNGLFTARVQVAVPSSKVPGTTWDMGASLVSSGRVAEDGSGRITLPAAGVPAVWEKDMQFSPGEYELVAVAHDVTSDELASKEVRGSWPKLETDRASFGPIAVSQPTKGGFMRNGATRTSGAVIAGEEDPLRSDAATAVVTIVCRAKDQKNPLKVVRTLVGEGETPVGSTDLKMDADERCAQILDLIPPKTLGPGSYRYVITARSGDLELARAERKMFVPDPAPASAAPSGR